MRTLLPLFLFCLHALALNAQDFSSLISLPGNNISAYASPGYESRAGDIAAKVEGAYVYFEELLAFRPTVTLLVLSKNDWHSYTGFPVYGMPHYNDDKTLVVAAEDNSFWDSFIPPAGTLPAEMAELVQKTYGKPDGGLSMRPFFDLLAIHELGHAFHIQAAIHMQKKWLAEIFVNMLLHNYIADKEPDLLPQLTVFPRMVISGGTEKLTYTRLEDVHEKYEEIGQKYPNNYGWYQCQWHAGAAAMHDQDGSGLTRSLWKVLQKQKSALTDQPLLDMMESGGCKTLAAYIRNWDAMIKGGQRP